MRPFIKSVKDYIGLIGLRKSETHGHGTLSGRKLGGILVEAGRDDEGNTFAVCGIGINLESAPRELGAICLAELGATPSFSARLSFELRMASTMRFPDLT